MDKGQPNHSSAAAAIRAAIGALDEANKRLKEQLRGFEPGRRDATATHPATARGVCNGGVGVIAALRAAIGEIDEAEKRLQEPLHGLTPPPPKRARTCGVWVMYN